MDKLRVWVNLATVAVIVAGAALTLVDLEQLPVPGGTALPWATAMLGATMMGWGVTVLLVAQQALQNGNAPLLRAILLGIGVWFVVDTGFSAWLGVYFNCLVNVLVLAGLGYPLLSALRHIERREAYEGLKRRMKSRWSAGAAR